MKAEASWTRAHGTGAEIQFVNNLGTFAMPGTKASKVPVVAKLAGYLSAARRRSDWGDIDDEAVLAAVQARLAKCAGGAVLEIPKL